MAFHSIPLTNADKTRCRKAVVSPTATFDALKQRELLHMASASSARTVSLAAVQRCSMQHVASCQNSDVSSPDQTQPGR